MKIIEIHKEWLEVLYPCETVTLSFLNHYQKENGKGFYGKMEDLHKLVPFLSVGTLQCCISKAVRWEFLKLTGGRYDNRLHEIKAVDEYYAIPDYIFMSDKLSPLQKLIYAYIYTTHYVNHNMSVTKEEIRKNLNVMKNRYFEKDLFWLVNHHFVVMINGAIFRTAPIPSEESFTKLTDWHDRYQKKGKNKEKEKPINPVKAFFIKIWNFISRRKSK